MIINLKKLLQTGLLIILSTNLANAGTFSSCTETFKYFWMVQPTQNLYGHYPSVQLGKPLQKKSSKSLAVPILAIIGSVAAAVGMSALAAAQIARTVIQVRTAKKRA